MNFLASLVQWNISRVILKIKALVIQWKDTPLATEFEPEEKHFASENFAGFSLRILSEGSAKLRWVGRVAHLGLGVAQKGVQRSSVGCSIAQKGAA